MFNYPQVCSTTLGSMLPLGVCSTTLGSIFNYPGEYVHYLAEYVTLGSMFNYPMEYFQLPWRVFSTTLGSARETPPKIEVPKVLCFTVLEPATTHFAAEWRR